MVVASFEVALVFIITLTLIVNNTTIEAATSHNVLVETVVFDWILNSILENKEDVEILFGVINQLNENQKTAFLLSKVDGLSNPEVAAIMQVSISSVESLVFRAKATLKEKLSLKFDHYRKKNN